MILLLHIIILVFAGWMVVRKLREKYLFVGILLMKWVAVPVYYYFFQHYYGDFYHFDAGKYFTDALYMKEFLCNHPRIFSDYLTNRLSFKDYPVVLSSIGHTYNWDDGFNVRWPYNDNKIIILFNLILMFFSSGNYFVHALWFCFFSWWGMVLWIRCIPFFAEDFRLRKGVLLMASLFPFAWFYTGAVLKEPLILFLMGVQLWCLERAVHSSKIFLLWWIFIFFLTAVMLRPPVMICISVLNLLSLIFRKQFVFTRSAYRFILVGIFIMACGFFFSQKNILCFLEARRVPYLDMAKGGIFLRSQGTEGEIRFPYDTSLVRYEQNPDSVRVVRRAIYRIHNPSWDGTYHLHTATEKKFKMIDIVRPARTLIPLPDIHDFKSAIATMGKVIVFFVLPVRFNGLMEIIYSLENLIVVSALFLILMFARNSRMIFFFFVFLFFMFFTSYTSPNIGSVSRYRAVWMPELIHWWGMTLAMAYWNIKKNISYGKS